MACIQFLEFESEADANEYARIWESNRGWNNNDQAVSTLLGSAR